MDHINHQGRGHVKSLVPDVDNQYWIDQLEDATLRDDVCLIRGLLFQCGDGVLNPSNNAVSLKNSRFLNHPSHHHYYHFQFPDLAFDLLKLACKEGSFKVAHFLLDYQVELKLDPTAKENLALRLASRHAQSKYFIARILCDPRQLLLTQRPHLGTICLGLACMYNNEPLVRFLLQNGSESDFLRYCQRMENKGNSWNTNANGHYTQSTKQDQCLFSCENEPLNVVDPSADNNWCLKEAIRLRHKHIARYLLRFSNVLRKAESFILEEYYREINPYLMFTVIQNRASTLSPVVVEEVTRQYDMHVEVLSVYLPLALQVCIAEYIF